MKCYHRGRFNFCVHTKPWERDDLYRVDFKEDLKKFKKPENRLPYDPSILTPRLGRRGSWGRYSR